MHICRQRKEKRKHRELKKKAKIRAAQLLAAEGGADEAAPDGERLFSLGVVPGDERQLKKIAAAAAPGEKEMDMLEADDSDDGLMVSWGFGFVAVHPS